MNMKCAGCGQQMPESWRPFLVGEGTHAQAFCRRDCALNFALVEVPRLRAWLRKISSRTKGVAAGLAAQALYSNLPP